MLRFGGGEKAISLPLFIKYPFYDEEADEQLFPFRTLAMIASFLTIVVVSYSLRFLFQKGVLSSRLDFLHCFREYDLVGPEKRLQRNENHPMTKLGRKRSSKF